MNAAADRAWAQTLIRETRALQGLTEHIDDDPVNVELAARLLASAMAVETGTAAPISAAIGAAAASRGSGAASRSNKKKAADADTSTASQTAVGS